MTVQQQMSVERAARIKIGRRGSVLERDRSVAEAMIEDLSTSGCFVRGDFEIAVGSLLAVGVPGIGTHAAKVMRLTPEGVGCAFLIPISAVDIEAARAAEAMEPPVDGEGPRNAGFIQVKDSIRSAANAAAQDGDGATPPKSIASRLGRALAFRKSR